MSIMLVKVTVPLSLSVSPKSMVTPAEAGPALTIIAAIIAATANSKIMRLIDATSFLYDVVGCATSSLHPNRCLLLSLGTELIASTQLTLQGETYLLALAHATDAPKPLFALCSLYCREGKFSETEGSKKRAGAVIPRRQVLVWLLH